MHREPRGTDKMQFWSWPTPLFHQHCLSGSTTGIHRPRTSSKGLVNPSQLCLRMGAWSYSHLGQWELCHQLQWEQDGALMLLLNWNGVQVHPLPRCGLFSFYSCSVFFLIGNNNFIESWPAVLAQPNQTRWDCSNKGSWNIKQEGPRDNSFTFFTLAAQASACCISTQVYPPGPQLLRPAWTQTRGTCFLQEPAKGRLNFYMKQGNQDQELSVKSNSGSLQRDLLGKKVRHERSAMLSVNGMS